MFPTHIETGEQQLSYLSKRVAAVQP